MSLTVRVGRQGTLTLPSRLRVKYGIQPGDVLQLVDLGGIFVLAPSASIVSKLAKDIEQARLDAGLTTEELLLGLREQRRRYYHERDTRERGD